MIGHYFHELKLEKLIKIAFYILQIDLQYSLSQNTQILFFIQR